MKRCKQTLTVVVGRFFRCDLSRGHSGSHRHDSIEATAVWDTIDGGVSVHHLSTR